MPNLAEAVALKNTPLKFPVSTISLFVESEKIGCYGTLPSALFQMINSPNLDQSTFG
jgi:hypothetical protein